MSITYKIANLLDLLVFDSPKPPYWIEIKTENPTCTYYFGHFAYSLTAKLMQHGYIKDLLEEKAIVVSAEIKQCQPEQLTIIEEKNSKQILD